MPDHTPLLFTVYTPPPPAADQDQTPQCPLVSVVLAITPVPVPDCFGHLFHLRDEIAQLSEEEQLTESGEPWLALGVGRHIVVFTSFTRTCIAKWQLSDETDKVISLT